MSEQESIKIPTNEEIINELTDNLARESLSNEDLASGDLESPDLTNVPPDFEDSANENDDKKKTGFNDFIDEEKLKELEATLTEEEKEEHRKEATKLKDRGNDEFKNANYLESIKSYTEGLMICPLIHADIRSALYSNRAASKGKLHRKEAAIDDCSKAIELNSSYVRAYLRRAKLYEETDKLDESLEDYKKLLELDHGNHEARSAVIRLPPKINERNEKMKTEMLGKLKDLGNMVLRPFGLSTENFQVKQDPNSGSYSINFQQDPNNQ